MKARIDHTVTFTLDDDEGDILPLTPNSHMYARVTNVNVRLRQDVRPSISASGKRCRKDGSPDRRMGNVYCPVDLPDPEAWVNRARFALAGFVSA